MSIARECSALTRRVTALLAVPLLLAGSLPLQAVTYKCRDAKGEWSSSACLQVAVVIEETAYMKYQRERQAEWSRRLATRAKLGMYCFRLDTKASFYDCVDAQMRAYDDVNRLARQVGVATAQGKRLAECVTQNMNATNEIIDYRLTRECYFANK
ncbi:MAG: hypothetical protein ABI411_13590 [Tahibacter sp.]